MSGFLRCMEHVEGVWRGRGRSRGGAEREFHFLCTSKHTCRALRSTRVPLSLPRSRSTHPSPWSRGRRRGSTTSSACQPTGSRRQVSLTRTRSRPSTSSAPPAPRAASWRSTRPASAGRPSRMSRPARSGTWALSLRPGKQHGKSSIGGLASSSFHLLPNLETREVLGGSRAAAAKRSLCSMRSALHTSMLSHVSEPWCWM